MFRDRNFVVKINRNIMKVGWGNQNAWPLVEHINQLLQRPIDACIDENIGIPPMYSVIPNLVSPQSGCKSHFVTMASVGIVKIGV